MSGETKEIKVGDTVTFANNPINFPDRHLATVRYIDPDRDPGYLIEWYNDTSCGFYKLSEIAAIVSKDSLTK